MSDRPCTEHGTSTPSSYPPLHYTRTWQVNGAERRTLTAGATAATTAPAEDLFGEGYDEDAHEFERQLQDETVKKMQASGGSAARYPLDLTNFASVRAFAARVVADLDTVDAVIHNAGTISGCTNTTDGFDVSMQTNYLAPVLLNRLFLPTLKANPAGRATGAAHLLLICCSLSVS